MRKVFIIKANAPLSCPLLLSDNLFIMRSSHENVHQQIKAKPSIQPSKLCVERVMLSLLILSIPFLGLWKLLGKAVWHTLLSLWRTKNWSWRQAFNKLSVPSPGNSTPWTTFQYSSTEKTAHWCTRNMQVSQQTSSFSAPFLKEMWNFYFALRRQKV